MRLKILIVFLGITTSGYAQSTWLKFPDGNYGEESIIINDTINTFTTAIIKTIGGVGFRSICYKTYSSLLSGDFLGKEIIDYALFSKDTSINNSYRTSHLAYYNKKTNKIWACLNYGDKVKGKNLWQSSIFSTNPFEITEYNLNKDTFETSIDYLGEINGKLYCIGLWKRELGKVGSTFNYELLRLKDNKTIKIKEQLNKRICNACHSKSFVTVGADNQNKANLILNQLDEWGVPNYWQNDILLLDSTGKQLWKCRPNTNADSFNTSGFQYIQKPNGNILCSWNNLYYTPYKGPRKYFNTDFNDSCTIWFAEIDYTTGKVLWQKNIRQYLKNNINRGDLTSSHNLIFKDVKLKNNTIFWVGDVSILYKYGNDYEAKHLAVLLKTDLNGTPIWFRQHEISPNDKGDKGMQVHSMELCPDGGFLLTGEYQNDGGVLSKGEYWQKAALLKLDSFGCWHAGCQKVGLENPSINIVKCKVYPNPTSQTLNIQYPNGTVHNWQLTLMDVLGKTHQKGQNIHRLNTGHLPKGIYMVYLYHTITHHYESHKVVVE